MIHLMRMMQMMLLIGVIAICSTISSFVGDVYSAVCINFCATEIFCPSNPECECGGTDVTEAQCETNTFTDSYIDRFQVTPVEYEPYNNHNPRPGSMPCYAVWKCYWEDVGGDDGGCLQSDDHINDVVAATLNCTVCPKN